MLASQRRKRLPPAPDEAMLRAAMRRTAAREEPDGGRQDGDTGPAGPTGPACALMPGIPRGTLLCELPPRDVPVVLCWDDC
ncbi:hypothetical protein [Nitratidesulfovibrio sp. 1201_IL3209]|uniref:hypothetical protein n=1 Tax=Nitratidesulfovibrio sp. 1201_IL3209 TaxID=3084053 RepID=UPI002FDB8204